MEGSKGKIWRSVESEDSEEKKWLKKEKKIESGSNK